MLIAFSKCKKDNFFSMTDSMNFGPDWIRNLSSESNTGGGTSGGTRYQLADYRYGREEMLALFDRNIKPPACLSNFKSLFAETTLPPLALLPSNDEERVGWQSRPTTLGGLQRGRGGSLERGGRITRGRGGYQSYGRPPNYESGWGNGEPSDWSPRKEYTPRPSSMDNWRRSRNNEEDDGWRLSSGRGAHDKWGRQTSWRGEGEGEERSGPPERGGRSSWHDLNRGPSSRKSWDEDHLPEWANENPLESGGSFDDRGAFHGSDDEQLDGKGGHRRDGLQKSTSQQHISHKQHPPLPTSKSTMSLVKDNENGKNEDSSDTSYNNSDIVSTEHSSPEKERKTSVPEMLDKPSKEIVNSNKERAKSEGPQKNNKSRHSSPEPQRKVEVNDFEKLQEDFLSKLVVDDDPSQQTQTQKSFELSNLPPPPNLAVPGQDKWFYQDPQGQMQGPFTNMEMSEWFKAGYFGQDLKVRRQCDERFFLLGELMAMCGGSNPFQTSVRFPVLKNDISKMPESDLLQFQYLSQLAAYKQAQARVMADPWTALTVQQQELAAQRLIMQQQQVQQDLQYMQQAPPTNPLMHMISQMQQQSNKLPTSGMMEKQPPNMTGGAMDPHVHMQMTNFLSLQNRLPSGLPNHMPAGIPSGVTGPLPPDNLTGISGLPGAGLGAAGMPIPGMPTGLTGGLGLNVPRPSSVEQPTGQDISSLLKQLQQKQQQNQVESLWQQCQFGAPNSGATQPQWPGQVPQEVPMSMWDIQQSSQSPGPVQQQLQQQQLVQKPHPEPAPQTELSQPEKEKAKKSEKTKENRPKDEEKELKKKKKAEEEQQKKDADEKRKQEQRKLEAEKKAEQEKRKKEEERIKKQLEKAKREAEEKRLRELEEKRKLKEQRKLEEEEKKKTEEERRLEEEERIRKEREQREREERERVEERRQEQISMSKVAPWSQANSTFGMSLAEIQKAEKERKAQEAALQAQRLQIERELQLQQQHQQQFEKSGGLQLGWAKKPMETRKVKSLAEIQAEEQERLAKEAAEARLRKDKETRETVQLQATSSIWSGQNLSWSNATSTHSQWMSASNLGFWEEPTQKPQPSKPSTVSKSSSMSTINSSSKQAQQTKPQQKVKPKKEEAAANTKKNHNNNIDDEFTNWCYKALSNMSTTVDIPTFVTFLRDIESAFEVREYCKDYLGESNSTLQFANNFLEKRRSFKPKNAHKDDMCSPAPAITPSTQYSTEFQEVKGKNKKNKKSKMLKVDARILGFNVTSAPDRINVGDRDYGDNS